MIDELNNSVGQILIYFNHLGMRFEGKILALDDEYLKYFDTHKDKQKFVRLDEIKEFEVKNGE